MAQKNAGDASPTASVLTSVRPWWTKSPALATGKATGSIHQKWLWRRIGDTIIGNGHRGVIATLVERKTQFAILAKSKTKQARSARKCIEQGLAPHRDQVHTITYDNGLEFAEHQAMAQTLAAKIYFAHPYSSWERGLNENTNGLIRQYLPKSRRLDDVTQKELEHIMHRLNHRPRKSLGFKTPYELFCKKKTLLTVALAS